MDFTILNTFLSSLHWSFDCFLCRFVPLELIPSEPPLYAYFMVSFRTLQKEQGYLNTKGYGCDLICILSTNTCARECRNYESCVVFTISFVANNLKKCIFITFKAFNND